MVVYTFYMDYSLPGGSGKRSQARTGMQSGARKR